MTLQVLRKVLLLEDYISVEIGEAKDHQEVHDIVEIALAVESLVDSVGDAGDPLILRRAGRIVAEVLAALQQRIRPGVNTAELDELAYQIITKHKAIPSFKGYRGFPASLCISINEEVVHGIPTQERFLKEGDIVSFDVGAIYQGYHGDAAVTVGVGEIAEAAKKLLAVTAGALAAGIAQSRAGHHTGDISWAIQDYAESRGYSVVREYTGHGIGLQMHEDPQIPNYGQP